MKELANTTKRIMEQSKWSMLMLRWLRILNMVLSIMRKILNIKLVIVSEYQNTKIFLQKGYTPKLSEEVFVIKKIRNILPRTYIISDPNDEVIVGTLYEKELKKTRQSEFRIEKVIMKKDKRICVKCRGYDSLFKSWNIFYSIFLSRMSILVGSQNFNWIYLTIQKLPIWKKHRTMMYLCWN